MGEIELSKYIKSIRIDLLSTKTSIKKINL